MDEAVKSQNGGSDPTGGRCMNGHITSKLEDKEVSEEELRSAV